MNSKGNLTKQGHFFSQIYSRLNMASWAYISIEFAISEHNSKLPGYRIIELESADLFSRLSSTTDLLCYFGPVTIFLCLNLPICKVGIEMFIPNTM